MTATLRSRVDVSAESFFEHALDAFVVGGGLERIFAQAMGEGEWRDARDEVGVGRLLPLVGGERNGGAGERQLATMSIDTEPIA